MAATLFAECVPALLPSTLSTLRDTLKFERMTPVQSACIPLFLTNKDVAVEACTGSGKTVAFVVPIVEILMRREEHIGVGAVIISPTRELARQTHHVTSLFCDREGCDLRSTLLIGGTSAKADAFKLADASIIVATPGRLADVLERHSGGLLNVSQLEVLVLDEADVLLAMGFHHTLTEILRILPKQRRTGLFSATQTEQVVALAKAGMRNPVTIRVQVAARSAVSGGSTATQQQRTPLRLANYFTICSAEQKLPHLVHFLRTELLLGATSAGAAGATPKKIIVFFATCAGVDFYLRALAAASPELAAACNLTKLHGRMAQNKRAAAFAKFAETDADVTQNKHAVLLCTDVAARGLDVPNISWIIQYDPPKDPDFFVHRVGRTARAGRSGRALVLLLPNEESYVYFLRVRKVPIEQLPPAQCFLPPLYSDEGGARPSSGAPAASPAAGASPDRSSSAASSVSHAATAPAAVDPATAPRIAEGRAMLDRVRALCATEREAYDAATLAFVSWVRAYKEHECRFIFRLSQIDFAAAARGFALLRLPAMPEMRSRRTRAEVAPFEAEAAAFLAARGLATTDGIKYTDGKKEATRVAELEKKRKKEKKRLDREKAKALKEAAGIGGGERRRVEHGGTAGAGKKRKKKGKFEKAAKRVRKGKHEAMMDAWEEEGEEESLVRRHKKGKMSKAELDAALDAMEERHNNAHAQKMIELEKKEAKANAGDLRKSQQKKIKQKKEEARSKRKKGARISGRQKQASARPANKGRTVIKDRGPKRR